MPVQFKSIIFNSSSISVSQNCPPTPIPASMHTMSTGRPQFSDLFPKQIHTLTGGEICSYVNDIGAGGTNDFGGFR